MNHLMNTAIIAFSGFVGWLIGDAIYAFGNGSVPRWLLLTMFTIFFPMVLSIAYYYDNLLAKLGARRR